MGREEILYLSVRQLSDRIRARRLSPVALTESYLERCRRLGPRLNAFALLMPEVALDQAREAEKEINTGQYRGRLHGIPYAAKDLLTVAGYPCTWGARPYASQKFDSDATVIRKLREAGAVLLGKAAMIELAGGMGYRFATASISGPARNPWNEGCWTCGSSSGSGAIVAAALAAFAIGTETWGSIICPSSYCGVSGLRPTFGRVGRAGAMALSYSMDKIGPMARTADDCAIVLSAIAGHDPQDLGSLPASVAPFPYPAPFRPEKPLRIGWIKAPFGKRPTAPGVDDSAGAALEVLRKHGADVTDAELPAGPWEAAGNVVIAAEGAAAFENLIESGDVAKLNDPMGQVGGYVSQQIAATDFLRALRVRSILQEKMNELFRRFDLLAAPAQPVPSTALDMKLDDPSLDYSDPLGAIGNLCGLPAVSVPCGFSGGKPVGLQFIGQVREERSVITAAHLFQQHTDWHRKRPPVG